MKLTKPEFAAALKRGQGRTLQYVRQHGLSEVGDLVLESCLKNPAYDRQCEGSRAAWLFRMFQDSEDYDRFSAAILSALSSLPSEADSYDLEHLCELAALMAKAGDEAAATELRSRVLAQPLNWPHSLYGCQPLVALDGVPAVVALARRFGLLLIEEPDERPPSVDYLTDDLGIFDAAAQELQRLAETDWDIKRYLDNQGFRTRLPYDDVLVGRWLGALMSFLLERLRLREVYPRFEEDHHGTQDGDQPVRLPVDDRRPAATEQWDAA